MRQIALKRCYRTGPIGRRALTVVELALAFTVLAILLATSMRMMRVVADQQRTSERRDRALQAVQAVTEQVGNIPWNQFTTDAVDGIAIPTSLAERLPGAKLSIQVNDESDPTAKRVLVQVRWNVSDSKPSSVRLTSWVFPD